MEVNDKLERAEKMLRDAEVVTRDGLPTKDPEPASTSRILGLQPYKAGDGATHWARCNAEELSVPAELMKRKIFSWCHGQARRSLPFLWMVAPVLQFTEENDLFGWHRLGQACV